VSGWAFVAELRWWSCLCLGAAAEAVCFFVIAGVKLLQLHVEWVVERQTFGCTYRATAASPQGAAASAAAAFILQGAG
jgi:hypothetical protein